MISKQCSCKVLRNLILLKLIVFCTVLEVHSQENIKVYDSLYQPLLGFSGQATFDYYLDSEGNKVKNGTFNFKSKKIDTACGTNLTQIRWNGTYNKDNKTGEWHYWNILHDLSLKDVDSFKIDYNLNTISQHITGNFENGTPNGNWDLETFQIKNGKDSAKVKDLSCHFLKAKFSGPFTLYGIDESGKEVSIEGQAGSGLMEGEWTFNYYLNKRFIIEKRQYQKGFLVSLLKKDTVSGDTLTHINYPLSKEVTDFLESDNSDNSAANHPLSLTYSDGYPRNSPLITEQEDGNSLLQNTIKQLLKYEKDFFNEYGLPVGTNRMLYPLNLKEKRLLKEWPEREFLFRKKVNDLIELAYKNFKYNKKDTLQMIHSWIDRQKYIIDYIKPWNDIFSQNELEFYNRKGKLYDYAQNLLQNDTLRFDSNRTLINYEVSNLEEKSFLFYVTENFDKRIDLADSLTKIYKDIVKELVLSDEVVYLKEQILLKKNQVDSLYKQPETSQGKSDLLSVINERFVKKRFTNKYQQFLNRKGTPELQKNTADSLLFGLNLLEKLYFNIEDIFSRRAKIDSLYTEYIFDPYTFNDRFPKRVKKKLYEVAAEDIFSCLIQDAIAASSVIELERKINRIEKLQERLIFLVDKDTRKLEKKLKRRAPINEKLKLLKIE